MVAGRTLVAFEGFVGKSEARCDECLALIAITPAYAGVLVVTLAAGSRLNGAKYLDHLTRLSSNVDLRHQALFALQRIDLADTILAERATLFLEGLGEQDPSDAETGILVTCAFALLSKQPPCEGRLEHLLLAMIPRGGEHTLHAALEVLAWTTEGLARFPMLLDAVLLRLGEVRSQNRGTVTCADYGLTNLLDGPHRALAIEGFERLIGHAEIAIEDLPAFSAQLEANSSLRDKFLTRWLRAGDPKFCWALERLVRHASETTFQFAPDDSELAGCDDIDLLLMVRRAIGYLFAWPALPLQIGIALLGHLKDESHVPEIASLLLDPLLLNHPNLLNVLTTEAEKVNGPLRRHFGELEETMRAYLDGLHQVGRIPELAVGAAERESYARRFDRLLKVSMRESEKESPLLSMVKKSVLLYGRASVYRRRTASGESVRVESPLHQIEHQLELPRMLTIDPLSLEYTLCTFRAGRRKNEAHH